MPNPPTKRISALDVLAYADLTTADYIPIVDDSELATKRVTIASIQQKAVDALTTEINDAVTAAEAAQTAAETAQTAAETAETNAETAQSEAEAARDSSFTNATLYADESTGRAAVSDGVQFSWLDGDEVVRSTRVDSGSSTELARFPLSTFFQQYMRGRLANSFPRDRNLFGLIFHPEPNTMTANSASIPSPGRFSIPAGIGEDYRSVITANGAISSDFAGGKLLMWLTIDSTSGTFSAPAAQLISTTNGTENLTFTEEIDGLWVLEQTIPASGYSAATFTLTSTDASNAITGTLLNYAFSLPGAVGYDPRNDVSALRAWASVQYQEGPGNLWPIEKSTYTITSGDSLEAKRANGITVGPDEEITVFVRAETPDGDPAILDRMYMRGNTAYPGATGTGQATNIFLYPLAGHPGTFGRTFSFGTLDGATTYLELNVDNAQASAFYTQTNVNVTEIQVYRNPPTAFYLPSVLRYQASDGLQVSNYDGLLDVHTPLFTTEGREYLKWQTRAYDTTGNPYGGGPGSVLEDLHVCYRTGRHDFQPRWRLTDVGLWEFAMKKDDGSDENVGHDVHGGMARRADPEFYIDSVLQDETVTRQFLCDQAVWKEYYEIYDLLDGTTVIAHLDTTKTWENGIFKISQELEFQANLDMLVAYMFMASFYGNVDNDANNGALFSTITMPDEGGAAYTPGGGVDATYPDATRWQTTSASGLAFDIAVQGTPPATYRSWVQSGSTRKWYLSPLGQRDSFGILAERTPLAVTIGQTFSLETWVTVTKS